MHFLGLHWIDGLIIIAYIIAVLGIVTIVLRLVTTGRVGRKEF